MGCATMAPWKPSPSAAAVITAPARDRKPLVLAMPVPSLAAWL